MGKRREPQQQEFDPNADRYPKFEDVLAAIREHAEDMPPAVERVEITCLASGEATYRYWKPRDEDYRGGYLGILS